jgi:hypothetical protein
MNIGCGLSSITSTLEIIKWIWLQKNLSLKL